MSTSQNKFILLMLLALLQCFAPLLHAHTHGLSAASGVHIDGVNELLVADSGKPAFMVDREEAPAIAMAQEYRQDGAIALSDAEQPALITRFFATFIRLPFLAASVVVAFSGGPPLYSLPFAQAPPL